MHQLQIHLKNHLQPYSLNFADGAECKNAFDVILLRRRNKIAELITLADDFGGIIALNCDDVSLHVMVNTENTLRLSAENQVMQQVYINKAGLREAQKPQIQPAAGFVS